MNERNKNKPSGDGIIDAASAKKKNYQEPLSKESPSPTKVIFQSALGQWDEGIKILKEKLPLEFSDNFEIPYWDLRMDDNTTVIEPRYKKLRENISNCSTVDNLHIFVAPMTWAAKYSKLHKFIVIGPAFGTIDDLIVFARKDLRYDNKKTRIGVINHDITSAILVKFFISLKEKTSYTLNKNIHKIIQDALSSIQDSHLENDYECPNLPTVYDRVEALTYRHDDEAKLDYAVFTRKEIEEIDTDSELRKIPKKKVMTLDRVIAHFFNLCFVPRSVYCIHEKQYHQYKFFIMRLFTEIKNVINKSDFYTTTDIRPVDYQSINLWKVQNGLINYVNKNWSENTDLYTINFINLGV